MKIHSTTKGNTNRKTQKIKPPPDVLKLLSALDKKLEVQRPRFERALQKWIDARNKWTATSMYYLGKVEDMLASSGQLPKDYSRHLYNIRRDKGVIYFDRKY
jgi:hypothetical protein